MTVVTHLTEEARARLIGEVSRVASSAALVEGKPHDRGDLFLRLCFMSDTALRKLAKACGINP